MNFELQFREKKLQVRLIQKQKKHFLDLLLLGDEQEEMVDRYLDRGDLWVVFGAQRAVAVAVVITREDGACELKNMAVEPSFQNQGLGSLLLNYLCEQYRRNCHTMYVGTGETVKTMHFYEKNGFVFSHRISNFFSENYDHPIIEDGVLLTDMVYFKRRLKTATFENKK